MAQGNRQQAPTLIHDGDKMLDNKKWGFAQRSHELEIAMMNGLGAQDMSALKIMLFFTGNAGDGSFVVPCKTVMERCNITKPSYYKARKKLVEMGWIDAPEEDNDNGGQIIVHFDNILNWNKKNNNLIEKANKGLTSKNRGKEVLPQNDFSDKGLTPKKSDEGLTSKIDIENLPEIEKMRMLGF